MRNIRNAFGVVKPVYLFAPLAIMQPHGSSRNTYRASPAGLCDEEGPLVHEQRSMEDLLDRDVNRLLVLSRLTHSANRRNLAEQQLYRSPTSVNSSPARAATRPPPAAGALPSPSGREPALSEVERGPGVRAQLRSCHVVARPDVLRALARGGRGRPRARWSAFTPPGSGARPQTRSRTRAGRPARSAPAHS